MSAIKFITDESDKEFKRLKRLETKKGRVAEGSYLVESDEIVLAAILTNQPIKKILMTYTHAKNSVIKADVIISDEVAKALSMTYSPNTIFAEIELPVKYFDPANAKAGDWLLLDGIQDAGNLGTIIRTANAVGFKGVAMSPRTADIFNPKVVRAMKGASYKLEVIPDADLSEWVTKLQANGYPVYGTLVDERATDYRMIEKPDKYAVILGNEGHGMSQDLAEIVDDNLYIPQAGDQDSLNVAIAGAVLMYKLSFG